MRDGLQTLETGHQVWKTRLRTSEPKHKASSLQTSRFHHLRAIGWGGWGEDGGLEKGSDPNQSVQTLTGHPGFKPAKRDPLGRPRSQPGRARSQPEGSDPNQDCPNSNQTVQTPTRDPNQDGPDPNRDPGRSGSRPGRSRSQPGRSKLCLPMLYYAMLY